ncbi:hypothetical protein BDW60DRAFT_191267 [Aspergillus nidulans var. acristatus]
MDDGLPTLAMGAVVFYFILLFSFGISDWGFSRFLPAIFLVLSASREHQCQPIIHSHCRNEEGRMSCEIVGV